MAFQDQVEDLTSLSVSDTGELSQFLKDGVLDVTNRWLAIKPQDIELFGRESSEQTSNGSLNLNGARIISVIREDGVTSNNWRACRQISPSEQYLVTDEESLSFASKFNPVYMVGDAGKISVFPAPGSDPNAFKTYYVNKDPVNSSGSALIHSHDDILYFPIDKVYLVVMYAGIRLLNATMGSSVISLTSVPPDLPSLATISFSESNALSITATEPTAISLGTVSYTDATNADASATAVGAITVATVTKADISGDVPTYTKPGHPAQSSFEDFWTVAADTLLEDGNPFGDNDPGIFSITAVPPDVPTITASTISFTQTAPTYTKPSVSLTAAPTIGNLTISVSAPTAPSLSTITFSSIDSAVDASLVAAATSTTLGGSTTPPAYTKPGFVAPTIGGTADELTDITALDAENTIDDFDGNSIEVDQWFATAAHLIEDEEDTELAAAQLQKIQTYITAYQAELGKQLQVYQTDIQNELNEFNKENVAYQSSVQEAMAEFQSANQMSISNAERSQNRQLQNSANDMKVLFDTNAQAIQKYQAEIQSYQQSVADQVQEYQQNLAGDLQVWQAERTTDLQEYASNIQNELNEFNKENAAYQVELQVSIQNAQLEDAEEAKKLQKYGAEVQEYQAEVGAQVQEYTQKFQRYQQEMNTAYTAWAKTESDNLQVFQLDIQNELNEFNKENARYQANVQAELAKHNSDLQKALTQAQLDAKEAQQEAAQTTDIDKFNKAQDQALALANAAKQIEDVIADNNAQVQRFQSMAQHYATQVNEDVQKYTSQLQSDVQTMQGTVANNQALLTKYQAETVEYQAEVAAETQEQSVKMQQYQLLYNQLKAEYDQAFMIAAPKQQAEA